MMINKLIIDPTIEAKLLALFTRLQTSSAANTSLQRLFIEENLNKGQKEIINFYLRENDILKPLAINWSVKSDKKEIITTSKFIDKLLLGQILYPSSYYCFQSSLYCLGIIKDLPLVNHLAKERPKYGKLTPDFKLTNEIIKSEFQKQAKKSKRSAQFDEFTFYFSEREFKGKDGVILVQNPTTKETELQSTNLERTLIDIAISPHNVGGFREACRLWKLTYEKSNPDLNKMYELYTKLNHKYPYWQRIGLILKKYVNTKKAFEWKVHFGEPNLIFYADRLPQQNWNFDSEWNLFFPEQKHTD